MSDVNTRLQTITCETNRDLVTDNQQPQRRYTEGASFRSSLDYFPNERSNTVSDIPNNLCRSLSQDFQDSFDFMNAVQGIMSHPGGTNSLPAFLTGRSGGHTHSTLLQQAQSNRAIENDYCDNPPPQRIVHSRTRGHSRNARAGSHEHHHRRHRHHRDPNAVRHHTRSSNRRHCNREEGTQVGLQGTPSTSASTALRGAQGFDIPPPRPPLSKYHAEHRYAGRALRASSSLPASLPIRTGDDLLVPMPNNPMPSYQSRHGRNGRHRSATRPHPGPLRKYSLTPPPVCRANKPPRYDISNNRIIQTVSSPSVVTQCVDSSTVHSWSSKNQWSSLPSSGDGHMKTQRCSSEEKKPNLAFTQPTHVVISQQPKRSSKKKMLDDDDDDDEIAKQKKSLVVNMNNNFAKTTQPSSEEKTKKKKKTKSSKSYETKDSKKHEFEKLMPAEVSADNGSGERLSSTEITSLKSGERCPRCGKCSEIEPDEKKSEPKKTADNRCDSAVDNCVETATCFCCVKGLFYHCLSHEDEETFAEKPCSRQSEKCCLRWSIMGILSLCLPCLCCYPLARGGVKLCRGGCGCIKSDCQCNEPFS